MTGPPLELDPQLAARLELHRERADDLVDASQLAWGMRIPDATPEERVALVVVLAARAGENTGYAGSWLMAIPGLLRGRLPFVREDAQLLFLLAERCAREGRGLVVLRAFLAAVDVVGAAGLEAELERSFAIVDAESFYGVPERSRVRARLLALVREHGGEPSLVRLGDDDWARRVGHLLDRPGVGSLLAHLATASQTRPTARWLRELRPLLDEGVVRELLTAAAAAEPRLLRELEYEGRVYREEELLTELDAVVVKGTVWAAGAVDSDWVPELLERVFERVARHHAAVANACVNVLGELEDGRALAVLTRLLATVKDRGYRKLLDRALSEAAARRGLSPSQAAERAVPTFGLDPAGRKEVAVGDWAAVLEVEPSRVATRWRGPGGDEQRTTPAAVKEHGALADVKAAAKELRKALAAERARLEGLLAEDAVWTFGDWAASYRDHPLVGLLTRRLLWRFDADVALGREAPETAGEVRLWHPATAAPDEVQELRRTLLERELVQPFKQAYREIYVLAPAERETGLYSNRFAAHVLHYPQTYALLKERGWGGSALGPWDGGYATAVSREFRGSGLRAEWFLHNADAAWDGGNLASLATTDQVRFRPLRPRNAEPIALEEVPPLVFSEAMRDVDLFVGVSSVGADPTWADGGPDAHQAYWNEFSFGDLDESAEIRREVLAGLIPKLRIADRLELGDRYLRVRGDLRTYRIHLRSANILMEPADQYLCIVPAPTAERPTSKVFLPFEDDRRLNVILAKAFLLANDTKIGDPTITQQITARR